MRGTPAYMAPEQIRGEAANQRCDLFAFGILLYELLTGRNPFARGGVDATFDAILAEPAGGSSSGCRRFRERSIRWSTDCSRRIRRRDTSPSGRFARHCVACLSISPPLATQPPSGIADRPAADHGTRLIGRDPERSQLLQCVEQARSGRGSFILLLGDAGIGKPGSRKKR